MAAIYIPAAGLVFLWLFIVYSRRTGMILKIIEAVIPELRRPKKDDRIIVFSPHPDDEIISSAGIIFESLEAGAKVKVVIVTDGNKRGLKRTRRNESLLAGKVIGLNKDDIIFWDFPDGRLFEHSDDMIKKVAAEIGAFRPTIVIFPSPSDYHRDHTSLGIAVSAFLHGDKFDGLKLEYLIHYPAFPAPKKYAPKRSLIPPVKLFAPHKRKWRKLTLSKEAMNAKEKSVRRFRTQLAVPRLGKLLLSFVRKNELFLE